MRYIDLIQLVRTYLWHVAITSKGLKFHQDSAKTDRLVCVATDRRAVLLPPPPLFILMPNIYTL